MLEQEEDKNRRSNKVETPYQVNGQKRIVKQTIKNTSWKVDKTCVGPVRDVQNEGRTGWKSNPWSNEEKAEEEREKNKKVYHLLKMIVIDFISLNELCNHIQKRLYDHV